jgi:sugar O-acyltransferase (sialic acid O-acetyltransferase NeuD family)
VSHRPYDPVKRFIDVAVAAVLLVVTAPIQLVVALLVRSKLGRPVLFRQPRPGQDEHVFELAKFRTMRELDPARDLVTDADRLTPFGHLLRSTSLDELPTLWNVLKGDMSLVGPRPLLVRYLDRYTPEQRRRHEVRPGITGLAQVSGRNALSWEEKFALDVEYVEKRGLLLDLKILARLRSRSSGAMGSRQRASRRCPSSWGRRGPRMVDPLVVIGAGGFGREVLDVIRDINNAGTGDWDILGVVDDSPSGENLQRLSIQGVPYLGTIEDLLHQNTECRFVVGVGSPAARRTISERLERAGLEPATLVHPHASAGTATSLGAGTIICAGARLTTNVTVGRHVHVDTNATVGHDTFLGDFVRLNPASSVSGDCVVEDDVLIGVAAAVLNRVRIGRGATIGGSACVVRDVAPSVIVKGVPAV